MSYGSLFHKLQWSAVLVILLALRSTACDDALPGQFIALVYQLISANELFINTHRCHRIEYCYYYYYYYYYYYCFLIIIVVVVVL